MRKVLGLLFILLVIGNSSCNTPRPSGPELTTTSGAFQQIDRMIAPGEGPSQSWEALLLKTYPEPVWLLGAEFRVRTGTGEEADPGLVDLLNVGWVYPKEHNSFFFPETLASDRIFRLSGKTQSVRLPEGYGVPMWSNEPLSLMVRWRNTNVYQRRDEVQLEVTLHFVRDGVGEPLQAVTVSEVFAAAPVSTRAVYGAEAGFQPESLPPRGNRRPGSQSSIVDIHGGQFEEEWLASPGQTAYFSLAGQLEQVQNSSCVLQTAYCYPGTESVTLVERLAEKPLVTLEAPRFQNAHAVEIPRTPSLGLRVRQSEKGGETRALAFLLLYFARTDFAGFPEMRQ